MQEFTKTISFKEIIIQEDEHLLFINKPAFYASLDDRHGDRFSIIRMAQKHNPAIQLCHRLDKETSGVMVLSKSEDVYREMAMLFEQRKVEKIYHAISRGRSLANDFEVLLPLSQNRKGHAVIDRQDGKRSETRVRMLEQFRHYTLFEC